MAFSLRKTSSGGTIGLDIDGRYLAAAQVANGRVTQSARRRPVAIPHPIRVGEESLVLLYSEASERAAELGEQRPAEQLRQRQVIQLRELRLEVRVDPAAVLVGRVEVVAERTRITAQIARTTPMTKNSPAMNRMIATTTTMAEKMSITQPTASRNRCCSLSGFGTQGPDVDRRAFDRVTAAATSAASTDAPKNTAPTRIASRMLWSRVGELVEGAHGLPPERRCLAASKQMTDPAIATLSDSTVVAIGMVTRASARAVTSAR